MSAHAVWARCRSWGTYLNRQAQRARSSTRHRLGYRGLVLLMFGLIYICIGFGILGARDYQPDLVHTHLPIGVRLALWIIPGVVAAGLSWDHKWQAVGFALLFIPPAERAVSYTVAFVDGPDPGLNWVRLPAALVYTLLVLTVVFIAAWPEPTELQKRAVDVIEAEETAPLTTADEGKYLDGEGRLRDEGP